MLAGGGHVESWSFFGADMHVQTYDPAGNAVGYEYIAYSAVNPAITPLPSDGYLITYVSGVSGYPLETTLMVIDPAGTTIGGVSLQGINPVVTLSPEGFGLSVDVQDRLSTEQDATFVVFDLSGHLVAGFLRLDSKPTITALANGDLDISWADGGGITHTLVIDPQNPPPFSEPPRPPASVIAFDNVGPVTGQISTITDDTTPTIRVAVTETGWIEVGQGAGSWFAVTDEDVARGYKEIDVSLPAGQYSYALAVRFESAAGFLSEWGGTYFAVETSIAGQTFTASNTRDQVLVGESGDDIFYTGHNSVVMTGDGGADQYVFQYLPWNNTGHITDFVVGVDKLDFTVLYAAIGYTGSNPVADGYVIFEPDGAGGSRISVDADGPGGYPWPITVTTLDHVAPTSRTAQELFGSVSPPPTNGQTLNGNDTRGQILTGGSGDDVFNAGHNSVVMTGDGGADRYVFQYLPWNAGHITDFVSGSDVIDLRPLFRASGYAGTNPIGDGYLRFDSDGAGGTKVMFDPDGPATGNRWAFTIVTLDHVQPSGVHAGDWLYA
jgi:hypothetical protein